MIEIFGMVLGAVALAQIAPGPNLLAVAGVALNQGRGAALWVAAGVATAIFIWVAAMAGGLGTLIALYPELITAMKLLGGGYLCFLAFKAFRAAWRGGGPEIVASPIALSHARAFRLGVLVNLSNPKSALMWAAVTTFMLGSGLSGGAVMAFAPLGFLTALLIYGVYGVVFSTGIVRVLYGRFVRVVETMFGLAFGVVGGGLIYGGVRDLAR